MTSLVLASGNAGKLREIEPLLVPLGWDVRPQSEWEFEEAVEDGLTFVENALIKARHASAKTGLPALADDSGLLVDALDGQPGLRSARYADDGGSEANIRKLMDELSGVPEEERGAHFYCVMVFLRNPQDPAPIVTHGQWMGRITTESVGVGGFGYDPVFFVEERGVTAAELPAAVKNVISHRGQALAHLLRVLRVHRPL
ncbi:MAG TPA: RdgB/HAM1 family non-canonical purine NTP pyrophosphatase [Xanthomonadales bacterium]|nr:RdgB/HAM1 family non-canonical purine NTP pyrophosphatase [Xanthomonadales bacterium]